MGYLVISVIITTKVVSERNLEIGQHLAKLLTVRNSKQYELHGVESAATTTETT